MGVRPGYKHTEVGVIPEDWAIGTLGEFWNLTDCKHVTAKFVGNGIPVASIKEVQSRFVDLSAAKQTTEQYYSILIEGGRKPQVGDLILSRNATVGEIAQVAEWHPQFAMGQDVCLLRKKSPEHSSDFLQFAFQSPLIARQLDNLMVGSTFKRVNVEQVRNFVIPFPSAAEQRAIAAALSDVDALIASQDRLIAKKRDMKQAAMQELLTGKRRLPGFRGEWEVKRLGELFSFSGGFTASRAQLSDSGYCYLHYGDIHKSSKTFIDVDAEILDIPKLIVRWEDVSASAMLKDGDIVFVDASEDEEGTSKHVVISNPSERPYISGLHTIVAKAKSDDLENGFKRHCFQTRSIKEQFRFYAVGTKVSGISKTNIAKIKLSFPSQPEQTAIAAILSDMDAEIAALEQKRDKTRLLKQGMMQELLIGRIRLVSLSKITQ